MTTESHLRVVRDESRPVEVPTCQVGICADLHPDLRSVATFLVPQVIPGGGWKWLTVCTMHRNGWWVGSDVHPSERPPFFLLVRGGRPR